MALTSQNAIDLLVANPSNYNTADKLRALVAQVDIAARDGLHNPPADHSPA